MMHQIYSFLFHRFASQNYEAIVFGVQITLGQKFTPLLFRFHPFCFVNHKKNIRPLFRRIATRVSQDFIGNPLGVRSGFYEFIFN